MGVVQFGWMFFGVKLPLFFGSESSAFSERTIFGCEIAFGPDAFLENHLSAHMG